MSSNNTQTSCYFCSGHVVLFALSRLNRGEIHRVWFCKATCCVAQTIPRPDDAMLHELHSTQYYRNGEGVRFASPVEWLVEGMRRWRIHRLSKIAQTGRALDIGCGSGRFLRALRHSGWEVAGLELNDDTATSARTVHGLVVETTLEAFEDASFDLITITHVLEHIRDPRTMLADCVRLLKPNGVIAVAVPNIESWQAQFTRENWFHLDVPRHLWHFSEKWLSTALNDLGFEQVAVRRLDLAHNIFGWLQSLLNVLRLRHNRFYEFLICGDLALEKRSYLLSLVVSILLLPVLLPISAVLAFLEAVFHAGGTVEIIARKIDR
jgi:SAM-dependent methyltransferase